MLTCLALIALTFAANRDLAAAERAFDEGRFEEVLPAIARARGAALSDEELARSYELEALLDAAYDDAPAELRAFSSLLALKPDYQLPPTAGPKMADVFAQAQRLRAPAQRTAPPPETAPPPPAEVTQEPPSRNGFIIAASAVGVLAPLRALGAEATLSHGVFSWLDLGGGVAVSASPGLLLQVALHVGDWLLQPCVQLRALAFWARGAVAWGGGASVGGGLKLGPGRVTVTVGAEGYAAPKPYAPYALVLSGGYALELAR